MAETLGQVGDRHAYFGGVDNICLGALRSSSCLFVLRKHRSIACCEGRSNGGYITKSDFGDLRGFEAVSLCRESCRRPCVGYSSIPIGGVDKEWLIHILYARYANLAPEVYAYAGGTP